MFHPAQGFPPLILTNKSGMRVFSDILAQNPTTGRLAHVLLIWFKN